MFYKGLLRARSAFAKTEISANHHMRKTEAVA